MKYLILTAVLLTSLFAFAPAEARTNFMVDRILDRLDVIGEEVYNQNPYDNSRAQLYSQVGNVIRIILSFVGLIAIILVIYGGFLWMTSAGNDDQINTARKTIIAAMIGLIIIISSWAITTLVINILVDSVLK